MIKAVLYGLILMLICRPAFSQVVPDSLRTRLDTTKPAPTNNLPVLSDTTQYNDTSLVKTAHGVDTVVKKKVHSPRTATLRSTIIPGWGQIYNKKYWKVPLVYGAIGFPLYLFFDNKKWYHKTRYALSIVVNNRYDNTDSMSKVDPLLMRLVEQKLQGSLVNYRNDFRRNMDYSILFTLLMYGVNIVDATVDGHLKGFDVGEDLSLKVIPGFIPGTMTPGVSLVLNFKH